MSRARWTVLSFALLCIFTSSAGKQYDKSGSETDTLGRAWGAEGPADVSYNILQAARPGQDQAVPDFEVLKSELLKAYGNVAKSGFQFAVLDYNASKLDVIKYPYKYNAVLVVVTEGGAPQRRAPSQSFLKVDPPSLLPASAVNKAAQSLEKVLGRRLYPYSVKLVNFDRTRRNNPDWPGAYAVFDVSTGEVLVDAAAVKEPWTSAVTQRAMLRVVEPMFKFIAAKAEQMGASNHNVHNFLESLRAYWPVLAGLAMVSKIPLWFCTLCPAILGLAMPLLINGALGGLAHEVCTHFKMTDEQCLEMWYGAFALGFLLSMASAIPIFYVCRLYQCEHPNTRGAANALKQAWRRLRF